MAKVEVEYEKKEVVLSRIYPFGIKKQAKIRGIAKEVTVITINELTGRDDESLLAQKNPTVYHEIALSCGLTEDEAKSLARSDVKLITEVQESFLYDSAEIVLID